MLEAPPPVAAIALATSVPVISPVIAPVIPPAKPITAPGEPAFQAWMKSVAALPAEKQVEAVAKKLQELNPGFDGKVTGFDGKGPPTIEKGVVTHFGFVTENVTDISPVRALVGLTGLGCSGGSSVAKLSDLSPLEGMTLD